MSKIALTNRDLKRRRLVKKFAETSWPNILPDGVKLTTPPIATRSEKTPLLLSRT